MTSETALSAEARDVVVKWLVAGMMRATVNTPAETEAYQHVVSGRAERALAVAAARSQPACSCFEGAPPDADWSIETTPLGEHQPWCARSQPATEGLIDSERLAHAYNNVLVAPGHRTGISMLDWDLIVTEYVRLAATDPAK